MNLQDIKPGSIIRANNWNEPIEVKNVEQVNNYLRIIVSTVISRVHIDQLISFNELNNLTFEKVESYLNSPSLNFFLAFEAKRFRYASLYDPLLAVNISKVDPLPHQIE